MDHTSRIKDLVFMFKQMRTAPGVNKQWLNKTIARLEEAEVFSTKIMEGKLTGTTTTEAPAGGPLTCTCPAGAVAKDCPVHNSIIV